MSIQITVSSTLSLDAFARIQALSDLLHSTDINFMAIPIQVTRSETVGGVDVHDPEDAMRRELLRHLVQEALKANSDSVFGTLR
ncbi:MAG: hypothetical protein EON54_16735 [Alcaligenaceae bacterium]|nr:MAG: hypothetical protein EON54_16735 [Alcaligenaceae bacterium]